MRIDRALITAAKLLVLLLAIYFLVIAVVEGGEKLKATVNLENWLLLSGVFCIASTAMIWIAFVWVRLLRYLGCSFPYSIGIGVYFVGESTKYLPGALWPILGRGELAVQQGVPRAIAYTSALLSILYNFVLSALLATVMVAPVALFLKTGSLAPLWLLVIFPIGILSLHPKLVRTLIDAIERLFKMRLKIPVLPWKISILFVIGYLPAWALVGVSTWMAAQAVGEEVNPFLLTFAMCIAWAAGFLAIPAPSGLGVREGVFIAVMGAAITPSAAAAIALITRVAFVFADAVGALVGLAYLKFSSKAAEANAN